MVWSFQEALGQVGYVADACRRGLEKAKNVPGVDLRSDKSVRYTAKKWQKKKKNKGGEKAHVRFIRWIDIPT